MIIAKISNGLGNQMFQYATARALASRHGVPTKLDLLWFKYNKARTYGLSNFQLEAPKASLPEILWLRGMRLRDWKGNRSHTLTNTHHVEYDLRFDPKVLTWGSNAYLQGYYQSELYFRDQAEVVRRDFQLRDPLPPNLAAYRDSMQESDSISVHIRRTDYAVAGLDQYVLPASYYQAAFETLLPGLRNPMLFVFSDDAEWAKTGMKWPARVIVVSGKETRDFQELALMASCKHHIIANSSFSWWGAWLAPSKTKKVIAPRNWLAGHSTLNVRSLIPESWQQI